MMPRFPTKRRTCAHLAALALVLMLVSARGTNATVPAGISLPAPREQAGAAPLLVDARWLRAQAPGSVLVLDASSLAVYRAGHIPGAVHAWWQDTIDPNGAVYGMVLKPDFNAAEPQRLRREYLEDIGVASDRMVVVYDERGGHRAARIVWTLRFLGHDQVALLDGGLPAWIEAGGQVSTRAADPPPVEHVVVEPREGYYIWTSDLRELLADPRTVLIDVRTAAERADTFDDTIARGAITGSVSIPWDELLQDASGRLLPLPEIAARFSPAGVTPDRRVVLYGNFGVDPALTWLALQLLGYPEVLIYDGGWAEWSLHPPPPD